MNIIFGFDITDGNFVGTLDEVIVRLPYDVVFRFPYMVGMKQRCFAVRCFAVPEDIVREYINAQKENDQTIRQANTKIEWR